MQRVKRFYLDDNNIGGAQEIANNLRSHDLRVAQAARTGKVNSRYPRADGPVDALSRRRVAGLYQKDSNRESQCCTVPTPAQVSANRRAKVLETETGTARHLTQLHHMHRRISAMYAPNERRKNPWDLSVHPAPALGVRTNRNRVAASLCTWVPNNPYARTRPRTAPTHRGIDREFKSSDDDFENVDAAGASRDAAGVGAEGGGVAGRAGGVGAGVAEHVASRPGGTAGAGRGRESAPAASTKPGVDWGAVLSAPDPIQGAARKRGESLVLYFKRIVLQEIVGRSLYRARDLRKLFRGVMDGCPDSMKVEMSRAVAESEAELMLGGDMEEGVAARGRGG